MKKLFTLLTLAVLSIGSAWAADEIIFSANPTAAWSVPASTTDAEITSTYATITGGKMYLTNNQSDAKDMLKKQGGEYAFQHTSNDTFFKVVLDKALEAGDVISARMQSRTDTDLGLWFSTATSRPSESTSKIVLATASSQAWVTAPTYTVTTGDGICGETTFYIYRHTGKSTYFNTFVITRPVAETKVATPTYTLGDYDATEDKYTVTLSTTTTGATIKYSTDNKASYSDYTAALTLAPGTTLDAYAVKDGLDVSDNMEQYTVPAAPSIATITFANGDGATGIVPAAVENVETGTTITLPKNFTMYKEGFTMTGWSDGETNYALGASYKVTADATLTAVFTENTVSLNDRTTAVKVTFDFRRDNGAPIVGWENTDDHIWVAQANIGGQTIDVPMTVTTNRVINEKHGKFNNNNHTDCAQVNQNTVFTVPSVQGAKVEMECHGSFTISTTTIDGSNEYSGTGTSKISYDVTSSTDEIEIVIGDGSYYKYLAITYPSTTTILNASTKNKEVILTKENINNNDYLTVNPTDKWNTGKTYGGVTGDFFNMSNGRTITIKVTGASSFEYYVQNNNTNDSRTFTIKVGAGEAQAITHGGTGVESFGPYAISNPDETTTITITGTGKSIYPVKFVFNPAVPIAITSAGWATFSCTKEVAIPEGVTAYVVSKKGEKKVTLSKIEGNIPAETGVVVSGGEGTYAANITNTGASISTTNYLVAWTTAGVPSETDYYTLAVDGNGPLFKKSSGGTLAAGKAYLVLPTVSGTRLSVDFDGGVTTIAAPTAIADMEAGKAEVYNLQGQRVSTPTKGLYIVGGKKVMKK